MRDGPWLAYLSDQLLDLIKRCIASSEAVAETLEIKALSVRQRHRSESDRQSFFQSCRRNILGHCIL